MRPLLLAVAVLVLLPAAAGARVGTLDPRFSKDGRVAFSFGADEVVPVTAVGDGAGGTYLLAQTAGSWVIARVTRRGALRGGFGRGGRIVLRGSDWDGNARPTALALQRLPGRAPRLLAAGSITGDVLAMYAFGATTGAPDPTFGDGGRVVVRTSAYALASSTLALGADGTVTFAFGRFPYGWGPPTGPGLAAIRLLADGAPDPTFGSDGTADLGADPRNPFASEITTDLDVSGTVRVTSVDSVPDARGYFQSRVTQRRLGVAGGVLSPGPVVLGIGGDHNAVTALGPAATFTAFAHGNSTALVRVGDDGTRRTTALGGSRIGWPTSVAVDSRDRAYVLTRRSGATAATSRTSVVRVGADGRVDRSFGRRGVLVLPVSRRHVLLDSHLALDPAAHRLWVVADDGDGLADVRDDFGRDRAYIASIRLR